MAFDIQTLLSAELHSIKNQMQALLSAQTELADQLADQPQFKRSVDQVQDYGQQLNHKMVELLSILKIQNTTFQPNIDEHWLCDTLELIIEELGPMSTGVNIRGDIDPDLNAFYDEQLLGIAVHNALVNAIQANATQIRLSVEELGHGGLNLLIQDNGPGFSEALLSQAQFHPQGTESGLGLYLMEQAMSVHTRGKDQGKLKIGNHLQGGAVVTLHLP